MRPYNPLTSPVTDLFPVPGKGAMPPIDAGSGMGNQVPQSPMAGLGGGPGAGMPQVPMPGMPPMSPMGPVGAPTGPGQGQGQDPVGLALRQLMGQRIGGQ